MNAPRPILERINEKWIQTPGGCWRWPGKIDKHGYGRIKAEQKYQFVHRLILRELDYDLPAHMQVDHLCRNRACCNPVHLDIVTGRVNTLRGMTRAALNAVKTHCIRGHEFTPENTRVDSYRGRQVRICRACQRNRKKAPR